MANTLSFEQVSALLNDTLKQAKGVEPVGEITTANFVAVGQTLLKSGYDNLLNAISVVLSETYFSIRPYGRKFGGLYVDSMKWGNIVRKIQVVDKPAIDNKEFQIVDGQSVDQYVVNKPLVLQLNFYGGDTYARDLPIFKNQLDVAFSSPDELGRFWTMLFQNLDDMVEQDKESMARMCVANFIGGKIKGDANNVVHLVSKYNEVTGAQLTAKTVRSKENWVDFCRWMFGYIQTLSEKLTERTNNYHINITGKPITRHTPLANQRVYLLSDDVNMIDTTVMSQTYHDNYLNVVDFEKVGFWQSINSPATISVKPCYLKADGSVVTPEEAAAAEAVTADVFGVIFDAEAMGCTVIGEWSQMTPMNARAGYAVQWNHYTVRYWNDFTENALILMLD